MSSYVNKTSSVRLHLQKDLTRMIKRGHTWVYADALSETPPAEEGAQAILLDKKGQREIARGYYSPTNPVALRVCSTQAKESLNDFWAVNAFRRAWQVRKDALDFQQTTGYRLFNGEGDGLPGLVCDVYQQGAVIKLDGEAAQGFWNAEGIAEWVAEQTGVTYVYERIRSRSGAEGRLLWGELPQMPQHFLESGMQFAADIVEGQKTGFFFDQRQNRDFVRRISQDKRVLNMFGYTGGFSVAAGMGGASQVLTVDLAAPAVEMADLNWGLNQLPADGHQALAADAFMYLEQAVEKGNTWDVVILDPPSFAPSEKAVPQAQKAYQRLIELGAKVTATGGYLCASSCSSHITEAMFMQLCEEGVSGARRTATVIHSAAQPPDHPSPLVMPELRYLKFVCLRVDR